MVKNFRVWDIHTIANFEFVAKTIRMVKEKPKESFAYDAREIQSSLRRKYEIK